MALPYHETQISQLCAIHTCNNILQRPHFTKADFDAICTSLDASVVLNAHRSMWGVGDYDANVLMIALGQEGLDVSWFDARLGIDSIPLGGGDTDDSDAALCAIITNVKSDSFFGALFGSRHWAALVRVGAQWFDLDSKREAPKAFAAGAEGARQMRAHLAACAATRGAEILLVRARAAEPPHAP